jgi:antitoxin component YwqK of YwqJK toxin-antitoxin module
MEIQLSILLALAPSAPPPQPAHVVQGVGKIEVIEERYADGTLKLRREVRRDRDGIVNHGLFESWHPNGQISQSGRTLDGRWDGLVVLRWDNGHLKEENEYKRGVRNGKCNQYWKNEMPKLVSNYKDGTLDGPFVDYRFGPEKKSREGAYAAGKEDGPWKEYDENGIVVSEGPYAAGVKQGLWIHRHPSGKTKTEDGYRDGQLDGTCREYSEAGVLIAEANYKAGKSDGLRVEWFPSGVKRSETTYAAGLPNGRSTVWFETGAKQVEGEMKDGKRNGRWTYWNADGSINKEWSGTYDDDKRVGD